MRGVPCPPLLLLPPTVRLLLPGFWIAAAASQLFSPSSFFSFVAPTLRPRRLCSTRCAYGDGRTSRFAPHSTVDPSPHPIRVDRARLPSGSVRALSVSERNTNRSMLGYFFLRLNLGSGPAKW